MAFKLKKIVNWLLWCIILLERQTKWAFVLYSLSLSLSLSAAHFVAATSKVHVAISWLPQLIFHPQEHNLLNEWLTNVKKCRKFIAVKIKFFTNFTKSNSCEKLGQCSQYSYDDRGWTTRGSNSGKRKIIFPSSYHLYWLWGPLNELVLGHSPRAKATGMWS